MGDSAMQVPGNGEGQCLSVCWRAQGHAGREAECAELALTMMVNREFSSTQSRSVCLGTSSAPLE